jgi:hypothetical protein
MKHSLIFLCSCAIAVGACGSDSADRVDDLAGTWMWSAGAAVALDCADNRLDRTTARSGSFVLSRGTSSDLILQPDAGDTCAPVRFDVAGASMTPQPSQSCTYTATAAGQAVNITISYTGGSSTLSADGKQLTVSIAASSVLGGGLTTTCTQSVSGTATKVGN